MKIKIKEQKNTGIIEGEETEGVTRVKRKRERDRKRRKG